jgi:hypothetical protein
MIDILIERDKSNKRLDRMMKVGTTNVALRIQNTANLTVGTTLTAKPDSISACPAPPAHPCLVKPVVYCCFSTITTEPSPHDDVPADLFSDDDDSTCLVKPVMDCCFTPCHDLSWFLDATLIHWNDRLVAPDQLPWILDGHLINWITRPVNRDKLVTHYEHSSDIESIALLLDYNHKVSDDYTHFGSTLPSLKNDHLLSNAVAATSCVDCSIASGKNTIAFYSCFATACNDQPLVDDDVPVSYRLYEIASLQSIHKRALMMTEDDTHSIAFCSCFSTQCQLDCAHVLLYPRHNAIQLYTRHLFLPAVKHGSDTTVLQDKIRELDVAIGQSQRSA